MLPSTLLGVAAVFATGIAAQTQTSGSAPSGTSSAAVQTYTIAVGAEGFKFTPNEIKNVSIGSILEFRIYPGGHAVARSDFKQPCIPYALTGVNHVGFYSGQISPLVVSDNLPKYSVRVNDTEPIFFYCTAPTSCIKEHMIGVVNPNSTETLDIQMQFANNATLQLTPGDNWPQEGASSTASVPSSTATSNPANTGASSSSGGGSSLSTGAIAGIAIGGAAVVILAATLLYLCGRRGGLDKAYRRSTATFPPPPMGETYGGNPKSPGQATFSTNHYSMPPPEHDPYRGQTQSPPHGSYMQHTPPPPISPHHSGFNTYQTGVQPGVNSPLMGDMQSQQAYYAQSLASPGLHTPPPPQQPPVELPTSADPGHSPLPQYQRQFSFSNGTEGQYRPGKP
ncbi:hypothetical protein GQ53DRAFT_770268 [Thozetella sp. PMI_491]|nr:hypothetical protein GQ53DRAFT_770268 [Thozetella sp. PMI_491]